jgi:parallel beta-helix repeat protein
VTVPLPSQGSTSWYSWAQQVHEVTTTGITDIDERIDALEASPGGSDGQTFSVTDPAYGAAGDGSTNDTPAVLAAATAADAAGGGIVHFPVGEYLLGTELLCENLTGVTFTGDSGARILCPSGNDRDLWRIDQSERIVVDGLTFVLPTNDLTHYSYGLHALDVVDFRVRNCSFQGGSSALRVEATASGESRQVRITDNTFSEGAQHPEADKAANAMVVGGDTYDVVISGNLVTGYREEGIAVDAPASTEVADPWVYGVTIMNNVVSDCGRNGINLRKVKTATVVGNVVTGCGHPTDTQLADGINAHTETDGAFCENITIVGNTVTGCEAGIGVDDCQGYTIAGNTVQGSTLAWSIHAGASAENTQGSDCRSGVISGNTVRDTYGGWYAITLAQGSGHLITGNHIDAGAINDARGISVEAPATGVYIDGNFVSRIQDTNNAYALAGGGITRGRDVLRDSWGSDSIPVGTVDFAKVVHGATASTARPDAVYVLWEGSVEPDNWIDGDDWNETA